MRKSCDGLRYLARANAGSMSALVVINVAIVLLILLFGLSVVLVFRDRGLLQNSAQSTALRDAVYMNVNDRAEQINNLVARSRELVFNSRESANAAIGPHRYLQPLAANLVMLARESAERILKEKKRLTQKTITELRLRNRNVAGEPSKLSPLSGGESKVVDLEIGSMTDEASNISALPGNAALFTHDLGAKYIRAGSNEYIPTITLKLPGADSDLEFTLSAMPRCDNVKPVQAKLISDRDFKRHCYLIKGGSETADEWTEFPSAQRITISQQAKSLNGHSTVIVTSSAASTNCLGAVP